MGAGRFRRLTTWAGDLDGTQGQADRALADGRTARQELASLQGQLSAAARAATSASAAASSLSAPAAGAPPPDPAAVRAATARAQATADHRAQLASAAADAQSRLDAARRLAEQARDLREDRGRAAASGVRDAADAGIPPRGFWASLRDAAATAWHGLVAVAEVVVVVLGVVALILGGPLAWVVFAAALVVFTDTVIRYAEGEAGLGDVALAALGLIPGTKGLTTLGALSDAVRAGGVLGGALHVVGAGRQAVVEMARAVRGTGEGAATWVRALASRTRGDGASGPLVPPAPSPGSPYLAGDRRLGAAELPTSGPVAPLLVDDDRLGGLTPEEFLARNTTPDGSWRWPDDDGFAGDRVPMAFREGERLDRFGPASGRYLSPAGSSYPERAIPPENLDPTAPDLGYNSSVVVTPFEAQVGYVAPAFEQPGGGLQVFVDSALVAPGERVNVQWLLDRGYLEVAR